MVKAVNFFLFSLLIAVASQAQEVKIDNISINASDVRFDSVLHLIEFETNLLFSYNSEIVDESKVLSISKSDVSIDDLLHELLDPLHLSYQIISNSVIISSLKQKGIQSSPKSESVKATIYGTVSSESGEPVIGANVFVAGTTIGTTSDLNGDYRFEDVPLGVIEVAISHIAYLNQVEVVNVHEPTLIALPIVLKENLIELSEIVFTESTKERDRNLKIFKREFIGQTPNSIKCEIKNPWMLNFEPDETSGALKVTCDSLLVVENDAIGLKSIHLMEEFLFTGFETKYKVKTLYKYLNSNNRVKERKWQKTRERTYKGSFQHFIKSLTENKLKKNLFKLYIFPDVTDAPFITELSRKLNIDAHQIIRKSTKSDDIDIQFKGVLQVVYIGEYERYLGNQSRKTSYVKSGLQLESEPKRHQTSYLVLNGREGINIKSGDVTNPTSFTQYGYWAKSRVADMLPTDYKIEK